MPRGSNSVVDLTEVAAGTLGDELADLGYEGHAEGIVLLQLVEGFLHFHGRRPSAVAMCSGEIVGSDHEVVDGAGDADGRAAYFSCFMVRRRGMTMPAARYLSGQDDFCLLRFFCIVLLVCREPVRLIQPFLQYLPSGSGFFLDIEACGYLGIGWFDIRCRLSSLLRERV